VYSNDALKVERRENMFMHESQITHFNGTGEYCFDTVHSYDERAPKQQGPGKRWIYVPWTEAQEDSYAKVKLVVKLQVDTNAGLRRKWKSDEASYKCAELGEKGGKRLKWNRLLNELK
jgi:hypothetical protein